MPKQHQSETRSLQAMIHAASAEKAAGVQTSSTAVSKLFLRPAPGSHHGGPQSSVNESPISPMATVVLLDPKKVVHSKYANREEASLSNDEFQLLKAEIASAGTNIQPIMVRRNGLNNFEVVFGHRRHRACLELGIPVAAIIEDAMTDQQLFILMARENRARADLTPYEQGKMYAKALSEGLFKNQNEMAVAMGVDKSALGKALTLAGLSDDVVAAFNDGRGLQYRMAKGLKETAAKNPRLSEEAKSLAKSLKGKNLSPAQIYENLTGTSLPKGGTVPPSEPLPARTQSDESTIGEFTIHSTAEGTVVRFKERLGDSEQKRLSDFISDELMKARKNHEQQQ